MVNELTHWGWVTYICVNKLTIIGSENGLPPGRRQAIIWTNAGILLIGPLGTNFNEILIKIQTFSFKKMHLKMSSGKWPQMASCLGLNVLKLQKENPTHLVTQVLTLSWQHFNSWQPRAHYRDNLGSGELTHWGRGKMAAVFQTTFSNAFSWMKMIEFRFKFHWSLFLRVQLTIFQHWCR